MSDLKHGSASAYRYHGCRCELCVDQNRKRSAEAKQRMRERFLENPDNIPHGLSGYRVGCRCRECVYAYKRTLAAQQRARAYC